MLPSAGLWLNASKSESMLESDETFRPLRLIKKEMRVLIALYCGDDRVTGSLIVNG